MPFTDWTSAKLVALADLRLTDLLRDQLPNSLSICPAELKP